MTLSIQQRAERCQQAIRDYSDDDFATNLVDFLADAMHWCRINDRDFDDMLDSAVVHFDAEVHETNIARS